MPGRSSKAAGAFLALVAMLPSATAWAEGCPVKKPAPPAAAAPPTKGKKGRKAAPPPAVVAALATAPVCYAQELPGEQCLAGEPLCDADKEIGQIAWQYFKRNYQPATGLVNAADGYTSTTMWDTASALAGTIAAAKLGIIDEKELDDRVTALLATLTTLPLFAGEAPNKAYNTQTAKMVDYGNKASTGIGYSALDLARLLGWLDLLGCMYPKHAHAAQRAAKRWSYCRMINEGQMYGAAVDKTSGKVKSNQEGRMGYEQYAGKIFARLGFDQSISATYDNEYAQRVRIYDVQVPYDIRDPRQLGAYNYVVTESYALDAMELGMDVENAPLVRAIFDVQKARWEKTGIVTAVSEDNIDRAPYFIYNTIFAAGTPWNTITDSGVDQSKLRTVSVKAAFSLATLFPDDPYASVLYDAVRSAYDPDKGFYSGIYESGIGYNKAITANTNGIILEALLYKSYGALHGRCDRCERRMALDEKDKDTRAAQCLPGGPPKPDGVAQR